MNQRPVIPVRVATGKPSPEELARLDRHWRSRYLLLAPHRLGFFLAVWVLVLVSGWWLLTMAGRLYPALALPQALPASITHAAAMSFGFFPLFFSGFLFTAAPKWLGLPPIQATALRPALLLQTGGWTVGLGATHFDAQAAWAGFAAGGAGLIWITASLWRMVRRSRIEDRLHTKIIGTACIVGCAAVIGVIGSLYAEASMVAMASVRTGLWGFVVVVYLTVAHRMIPFFTSSAMPWIESKAPFWVLWLMLAAAAFEVLAAWIEVNGPVLPPFTTTWMLTRGMLETSIGLVLLWLARVWALQQSPRSHRLLFMLYTGFLWLCAALLLSGVTQFLGLAQGAAVLSLGALHALTMGCLGSLLMAMVTRVSCGHSGRALVADRWVWSLFWALQCATVVRIAGAATSPWATSLTMAASVLWFVTVSAWGLRLSAWFGRLRADGRPG